MDITKKVSVKPLIVLFISFIMLFSACGIFYFVNGATYQPYAIVSNFGEDASSQMMTTWQIDGNAPTQKIQITYKTDVAYSQSVEFNAIETDWELYSEAFGSYTSELTYSSRRICRVSLDNLDSGTAYRYRVGSDNGWSKDHYFTTADDNDSDFTFCIVSDPQANTTGTDAYSEMQATLQTASNQDDLDFVIFGGDMSEISGESLYYQRFFERLDMAEQVPIATIPGNHETLNYKFTSTSGYSEIVGEARAYNAHFYNPQNGPVFTGSASDAGVVNTCVGGQNAINSSYYFYYGRALFVMINTQQSNEDLAKTADWLQNIYDYDTENNLSDYRIAVMHKGIFGNRYYGSTASIHQIFYKVFEDNNVDLVMSGHDHTYGRTATMKDGDLSSDESNGAVYSIIGTCGPKHYTSQPGSFNQFITATELKTEVYTNIKVDGEGIHVLAKDVDGDLIDDYFIPKKRNLSNQTQINVTEGSSTANIKINGNWNNVAKYTVENNNNEVLATIKRGESQTLINGLQPSSNYTLQLRTVKLDGTSFLTPFNVETSSFIVNDAQNKKLSIDTEIEYEYSKIFINNVDYGSFTGDMDYTFLTEGGVYLIKIQLVKAQQAIDEDFVVITVN